MTKRRKEVFSDGEVLELFRDEPELVAIVDALAATQARRRPAVWGLAAAAALLLLAGVVAALSLWRAPTPSIVEEALAAVETGRVFHVVARTEMPMNVIIDLASGRERPVIVEVESWFDTERGLLRTATRRQGALVADVVRQDVAGRLTEPSDVGGTAATDAALRFFSTGYRKALAAGAVQVRRSGEAGAVLSFASAEQAHLVNVDAEGRPVQLKTPADLDAPLWRVFTAGGTRYEPARFRRRPPLRAGPAKGQVVSSRPVPIFAVRTLLGQRALWPGRQVGRLTVLSTARQELRTSYASGRSTQRLGVSLVYGSRSDDDFVRVQQSAHPQAAYAFTDGRLTFNFNPMPPLGHIDVVSRQEAGFWIGQLRRGGLYLTLRASSKRLLLRATRQLRPIP